MTYELSSDNKYSELFDDSYRSSAMTEAKFGSGARAVHLNGKRLRVIGRRIVGGSRVFLHRAIQVIAESKMKRVERELRFHSRNYNRKDD